MKSKLLVLAVSAICMQLLLPKAAQAIPSWTRKYGMSCAVCHRPAPPRLNWFGQQFRKRGYRMEGEVGQKQEITQVGNYLALRNRVRFSATHAEGGPDTNQFQLNDITLFYSGALTANLSVFTELERDPGGDVGAQVFGEWTKGDVGNYYAVRWGQMHTLSRVGWAGFDRPTGISSPWVLSRALTRSTVVGERNPFQIGFDQRGLEYQHSTNANGRVLLQVLNGMNPGSSSIEGADDTQKDFLGAWEQALDDNGSGFTLFGYGGSWQTPSGLRDDFTRYALTGSWFSNLFSKDNLSEVQFGLGFGKDDVKGGTTTKGNIWYLDLEQYLPHDSGVFLRYEHLDPDTNLSGNDEQRWTLGGVRGVNDNLRLALELFTQQTPGDNNGGTIEAMINF